MAVTFLDTFTDTNGVQLENHNPDTGDASSWEKISGSGDNAFEILGNAIFGDETGSAEYYNSTSLGSADGVLTVNIDGIADVNIHVALGIRCTTDLENGVFIAWADFENEIRLSERVSGVDNDLDVVALDHSDQELVVTLTGTSVTVEQNSSLILSGTTAVTAEGFIGLEKFGDTESGMRIQDIEFDAAAEEPPITDAPEVLRVVRSPIRFR
jgi:hypothetical protein